MQSLLPLFPSYVFLYADGDDRLRALMTNRVAQVFYCQDGDLLRDDLQRIQRLIESGAPLTVESRMQPGQDVRVRCGALQGLDGIVIRRKNETRLLVWVRMLQQGVSLEIDDCLLEPTG